MLKLGAYGFIRLVVPIFPDVWVSEALLGINWATLFAILSMMGIVLGAFAAFGQNDIKRLVAYSSVNHMGFVGIGIAVMALLYGEAYMAGDSAVASGQMMDAIAATNGAVMQMFNHGLSSAGMFLLAGGIYHKTHTRDLREYGGFWVKAPIFGGVFIFMSMAESPACRLERSHWRIPRGARFIPTFSHVQLAILDAWLTLHRGLYPQRYSLYVAWEVQHALERL
ncbi:MAG: proton-conducting transporter membrane subunit [Anaerolineae bacterium]|nr:proton-conducting transporter membrane subunit [Anaerolineae bacterium]